VGDDLWFQRPAKRINVRGGVWRPRGDKSMIKSALVLRIAAQNPHLYQRDVENIVDAILGEMVTALARGDRIEIRGFGAFSVKHRPARSGRNARTGAHVSVEPKNVPVFNSSKEMHRRPEPAGVTSRRPTHVLFTKPLRRTLREHTSGVVPGRFARCSALRSHTSAHATLCCRFALEMFGPVFAA
jgi:integration host factor subunit beta